MSIKSKLLASAALAVSLALAGSANAQVKEVQMLHWMESLSNWAAEAGRSAREVESGDTRGDPRSTTLVQEWDRRHRPAPSLHAVQNERKQCALLDTSTTPVNPHREYWEPVQAVDILDPHAVPVTLKGPE